VQERATAHFHQLLKLLDQHPEGVAPEHVRQACPIPSELRGSTAPVSYLLRSGLVELVRTRAAARTAC
jgi:hypothetical protein